MKRPVPWLQALGLVVLVVIAYLPALSGGFVWDDDGHVTANDTLTRPGGLRDIWLAPGATQQYYPMVFTSFWLEARLWGMDPRGYHLVNVLLHGLGAVLLFFVLRALSVPVAWWAAAVFALHPVHVESVAWISERKNVLSGVFYLAAALAYLRAEALPSEERRHGSASSARRAYAASFVLFLAALFSKTVTCTLPVALVLVLWWKGVPVTRTLRRVAPFLVAGLALGLTTIWMETHHIGAVGESWNLSWIERCLVAGRGLWFYLEKLVWPSSLAFIYPRIAPDAGRLPQILNLAAAVVGFAGLWVWRARDGAGAFTALAYFAITLSPALGFVNVFPMRYSFVADHFQYLASIGPLTFFVAYAALRCARLPAGVKIVPAVAVLCLLGALTWNRARAFESEETLWRDTIRKNPNAEIAYTNLGNLLRDSGRPEEAEPLHRRAIELDPESGDGHVNLGNDLLRQNRNEEALAQYRLALEKNPNHAHAHFNLGLVLLERGDLDDAIAHLKRAEELDPKSPLPPMHLGIALTRRGRFDEAVASLRAAIALWPQNAAAWFHLGNAEFQAGRRQEAILAFEATLALDPNLTEARHNLAVLTGGVKSWHGTDGVKSWPGTSEN